MPPETAETGSPDDRRQLRAGSMLRAAVDGLGLSHKSFAGKAEVEAGTLRRLWTEGSIAPVLDSTKAGLLQAFRDECKALEEVPGIEELAEETNRRVINALLAGQQGIADWLMLKWWLQTGKRPMDDGRRSLLRTGGANVPEFSELLAIAREVGLLGEEGQTEEDEPRSPWDNQAVQDAVRAWLYEAVDRAGRPPGLARFVMALQLAGLQTTGEGLQRLGAQCRDRDIAVPPDETVDLTSADASLVVNHKVPPFTAVCNILQVVGAHTGRPGLAGEVEAMWSHVEVPAETSFGVLETHFAGSGFTFRELAHVVGVPYSSGAQENNPIYRMLRGKHEDAPFRAMALALVPDASALRSLQDRRVAEILQWHRMRGKDRTLPQAAVMRELWPFKADDLGLDQGGFDGLLYDRGGALADEDVVARMEQVGLERMRDVLVRWLQRRGFYSARQVMLAVCERHKLGDTGNGVAKLEKDVGYGDFRRFYDDEKLLLPTRLLCEMLQVMLGMGRIPPGLEARHRLAYGDFLAGDAGGSLTSRQRFFEAVMTNGYRSQRHYHTTLGHDDSVRQSFQRMFAKLGKGNVDGQILARHTNTLVGTAGVLQPRLHRMFVALTATDGSYPDAVAAVCREWLAGDDDDQAAARDLLAALRTPSIRDLAPHPLQEADFASVSLARLLDARWRTCRECDGSAWDEKEAPEFLLERRAARTLRLLPGITQEELIAAADLLRLDVASAGIDEVMERAPRPHTDETMARLAGFIAPLITGDQTEAGVLHRVQVSSSLFGQWRDAAARFTPPPPRTDAEALSEVMPRMVSADLLEIRRPAGTTEAEAMPDDEAEAALIGRWGAPELRLAVLVRRLALIGAMTTQPAEAGAVAVATPTPSSKPSEQQRLLMVQIIELLFAQHGDNDQLDRLCAESNVNANVLTTWRAMRKREETKRRAREQGTELDRLRAEVEELRALTGAPLQDAERDELVRLRARVAELEATEGTGIDSEERGELERLRLRVREMESRPERAEYDRVIRELEAFVGYVSPEVHAEATGRAADLQRQLEAMADHVPPGIHAAAVQRAEELLAELEELRTRTPAQPGQTDAGELQAELERLRDQLRSRPAEAVVQRVVHGSALPRELHGAFVKGAEITAVGADPVTALLDVLTAPTINAQAFLQLYRRAMDALGASAEIGGPMHDDIVYIQQYAAGVLGGRRDPVPVLSSAWSGVYGRTARRGGPA